MGVPELSGRAVAWRSLVVELVLLEGSIDGLLRDIVGRREVDDIEVSSQRDDLIIQLGAFVGLRGFEIPQARPCDVKETESGQYRLRVEAGKDTGGNGGNLAMPTCPTTSSVISNATRKSTTSHRKTPSSI